MPLFEGFIGGSYRARSKSIADDACINLYPEITEVPQGAKHGVLYGTPGLRPLIAALNSQGCRGLFSQDGRTFTVIGDTFYELTAQQVLTNHGTIHNNGSPCSFSTNGRGGEQLVIVGGNELKVFNLVTNTLSAAIVLPLTNAPVMVLFTDAYFLLLEADTVRVWFSALEDGTMWDALDFFARSETSDNLVGMAVIRDRIWVLWSQTSEVFYDSGDADNPFVPYPGSVMQEGLVSPWALTIQGEALYWLAQDNGGSNRIVSATDYVPVVVSTPPISYAIASYSIVNDCEALAYEQEGHPFVAFTFLAADVTWVIDTRENQWHQRDDFDQLTGISHRWRARGVCYSGRDVIAGDFETGDLYILDLDYFQNNGKVLRRERTAPYLSSDNQWIFVDSLEMGLQSGIGLQAGQGNDPQLELSISGDSGMTWGPQTFAAMGAVGKYDASPTWRMLGRVRADRFVVKIVQTDPVRAVWGPGLWLRVTPGTGQR